MNHFFAHSGTRPDFTDWQPLSDHLRQVAELAKRFAERAMPNLAAFAAAGFVAGLLHDLGKYQEEWQDYLRDAATQKDATSIPHAIHGAACAAWHLDSLAAAWAIAGHHTGLYDHNQLCDKLEREKDKLDAVLERIVADAKYELPEWPTELPTLVEGDGREDLLRCEFWGRVLFSILIDADRLNTEKHTTGQNRPRVDFEPTKLFPLLDAERKRRSEGKTDNLTGLRNEVFETCSQAGRDLEQGFFDLTVPTGGGKTFSAMAFALQHAAEHELRRVIVVIPYLSIIEQNAKEYRDVFGRSVVVEHHSGVEDDSTATNQATPYKRTAAELATENWDAPIIVTTSVQFLETLFAASTRKCRKLHNIAQSVVIFDEAQTLPAHLLDPLLSVFRELVNHFGVSIVFSTATQPAFRKSSGLTQGLRFVEGQAELQPILPTELRDKLFQQLCRVQYRIELDRPWNWDELVDRMSESSQVLCVLNTRAHARTVWEKLRAKIKDSYGEEATLGVLHLSSAMCAEHRIDILGKKEQPRYGAIRHRLANKLPCWLVSTQVIEAGVDIDFPTVFRAMGPLDSIVQAAGRCNREGKITDPDTGQRKLGEVIVFQPAEKGLPPGVYEMATGRAKTLLGEIKREQLANDPTLFALYFDELFSMIQTDTARKGGMPLQEERQAFNYRRVGERAKVIEDGGTAVLVPYKIAQKQIQKIRKVGWFDYLRMRKLQRFTVNLRRKDFLDLQSKGFITPLLPSCEEGPWVLDIASYHKNLGVHVLGQAAADFLNA